MGQINASFCETPIWAEIPLLLVPYRDTTVPALFFHKINSDGKLFFSPDSFTSSSTESQEDLFCSPVLCLHCPALFCAQYSCYLRSSGQLCHVPSCFCFPPFSTFKLILSDSYDNKYCYRFNTPSWEEYWELDMIHIPSIQLKDPSMSQ